MLSDEKRPVCSHCKGVGLEPAQPPAPPSHRLRPPDAPFVLSPGLRELLAADPKTLTKIIDAGNPSAATRFGRALGEWIGTTLGMAVFFAVGVYVFIPWVVPAIKAAWGK